MRVQIKVLGQSLSQEIAKALISRSQSFSFMPFPDDEYEFEIGQENIGFVHNIIYEQAHQSYV